MEADAALLLTVKMFDAKNVEVEKIVTDNDSSMKANVRYSFEEKAQRKDLFPEYQHPRTDNGKLRPSTGILPLHVPEPQWLVDPNHQTKVVGKRFFEMKSKGKNAQTLLMQIAFA